MVDVGLVAGVLSLILLVVSAYFGVKLWLIEKAISDVVNAMEVTEKALEDNVITPDEVRKMIVSWKRVLSDICDVGEE